MQLKVGEIAEGKIVSVKDYGVFVGLSDGLSGMVHISEIANDYVSDINAFVKVGDTVKVKVLSVGDDGKISLSIKRALPKPETVKKKEKPGVKGPDPNYEWTPQKSESSSFEEMMNKFKASSDEKFSDLKRKNPDARRSKRGANSR